MIRKSSLSKKLSLRKISSRSLGEDNVAFMTSQFDHNEDEDDEVFNKEVVFVYVSKNLNMFV